MDRCVLVVKKAQARVFCGVMEAKDYVTIESETVKVLGLIAAIKK